MSIPFITAEEAASHINNGDTVGFSGFTASGTPKVVSVALANRARAFHEKGETFKINLYTGASTNDHVDGELARANCIAKRTPYQSQRDARALANNGGMSYFDDHLSHLSQNLRYGFYGGIDVAIIEVTEMSPNGEVILGAGIGMTPTIAQMAKKVIIEYSSYYKTSFRGFHDNFMLQDPPHRREIPIYKPSDRIGSTVVKIDPKKIIGVVPSNASESIKPFTAPDEISQRIGDNLSNFLAEELKLGKLPKEFLPIQSGVGNVANAVLYGLGENPHVPHFEMYTEVIQDAVMHLMEEGKCSFASTCALTFSDDAMSHFMENIDFFRDKILMRPGEISNHPEVVRRLGLIAMNTRPRHEDDERHRRLCRLLAQRIPEHLLLPLYTEGRQDFSHRPHGVTHRPLRALSQDTRNRTGRSRPAWQRPDAACRDHHRKLRTPDVQGDDVGLPETRSKERRPYPPRPACSLCAPPDIHGDRRHVADRLREVRLTASRSA